MNLVEALAREIRRVAVVREHYSETERTMGGNSMGVAVVGRMIERALDDACSAIGVGEIQQMTSNLRQLQEIKE